MTFSKQLNIEHHLQNKNHYDHLLFTWEHYEKLYETQEQGGNEKFLSAVILYFLSQEHCLPEKGVCN